METLVALVLLAQAQDLDQRLKSAAEAFRAAQKEYEEALVELGPEALPRLEKLAASPDAAAQRAIERIRSLRERIEKHVSDLGDSEPGVRERATKELRLIGRPARSYLDHARRSEDREVAERARFLLLALDARGRDRARWASRAEAEGRLVASLEERVKKGLESPGGLAEAKRRWLRARCRAGEISSKAYFQSARELAHVKLEREKKLHGAGVGSAEDLLRASLDLAYLDRRLGQSSDEEVHALQRRAQERLRGLLARGLIGEQEYLRELSAWMTDPDEDIE